MTPRAAVDVVIPVYRGREQTARCIESALAGRAADAYELVILDDATPEPRIALDLDAFANRPGVTLLRNESNLGFVRSVNRGMSLHPQRDVVLLNSDTEVAPGWLGRLKAAAYSGSRIATATPFSNNATICSYPFEGWTGGVPGGLGLSRLDALFAASLRGRTMEIPTAVGFCMYIRRECLAELGLFDAERFGRGYGEENDFCMRAAKVGWTHVLAADAFVFHEGSVSFGEERLARVATATATVLERHPEYLDLVHSFIARDPLRPLREAIDEARLAQGPAEAAHVRAEHAGGQTTAVATPDAPRTSVSGTTMLRLLALSLRPRAGKSLRTRIAQLLRTEGPGAIMRRLIAARERQ
jgi:GT2 family glycosyltransferase